MTILTWVGIGLCLSQSAMLSGLNLAYFTLSKLQLELEVAKNNHYARRILRLRENSNFLLVTILWANVSVNVLLALLSESVLTGLGAFLFSTVLITCFGEIMPQAYFSRYALRAGALLSPLIRFYQLLLFPVARPTALLLDRLLGPEALKFYREHDLRELIKMHMRSTGSEIDTVEGRGSLNFLALDDLPVAAEGETVDPVSIMGIPFEGERPQFPQISPSIEDPFLNRINSSGKKWVILVDRDGDPRMVLESDRFLRDALFNPSLFKPEAYCHRPIIVRRGLTSLGEVLPLLRVHPEHRGDDVIDEDIILYWGEERHIITGSDILGRLLRGIVENRMILREAL
jgi:metal transporter CNNM